ncbi:MAG: hypothetical protein ACKOW5_13870 [Actinomycetales bacterium]
MDGWGALPRPRRISPLTRLARELVHFFAVMLWVAAERLRALLPARIAVRRDGVRILIDASGVVVGDLLLVSTGIAFRRTGLSSRPRPCGWTPRC